MKLAPSRTEGFHEEAAEARGGKNGNASIGAAGDKLQVAGVEAATVEWHGASIARGVWRRPEKKGLRQPAPKKSVEANK